MTVLGRRRSSSLRTSRIVVLATDKTVNSPRNWRSSFSRSRALSAAAAAVAGGGGGGWEGRWVKKRKNTSLKRVSARNILQVHLLLMYF